MRPRRAVLQIPPRSSVPPRLPLYKNRILLTHSESTLLQVLIPLHLNSPRINTYKKTWRGTPSFTRKVLQLVTSRSPVLCPHSSVRNSNPLYGLLHNSLYTPGWGVRTLAVTPGARALTSTCRALPLCPAPCRPFERSEKSLWLLHAPRPCRPRSLQECASISFHRTYASFVFILLRTPLHSAK